MYIGTHLHNDERINMCVYIYILKVKIYFIEALKILSILISNKYEKFSTPIKIQQNFWVIYYV